MEDLELPADLLADTPGGGGAGGAAGAGAPFVVPSAGAPATQKWLDRRTQVGLGREGGWSG